MTKVKQDIPLDLAALQPIGNHWCGFCILHVYPELLFYSPCHQTAVTKKKILPIILSV